MTRNDPDKLRASGGPITRDNTGAEVYCNIFALAECPHQPGVLWAGSDDGLVHVSRDAGANWREITPPDLPEWALISIIEASPHQPGAAYLAATRYKLDDTQPYLYKTTDYGASWTSIVDGIPPDEFTRVIREDPNRRGLLYAGTETGIYVSFDDGGAWQRLAGGLPVCPIHDLVIKDRDLVVATHGRSFWILDDVSPLHQVCDAIDGGEATLLAVAPKVRLRTYPGFGGWDDDYGGDTVNYGGVGTSVAAFTQGAAADDVRFLDAGHNPPAGIVLRFWLPEGAKRVELRISTGAGELVRSFSSAAEAKLTATAGLNQFEWNLRYAGATDVEGIEGAWERPEGPLALPGDYRAELVVDGRVSAQRIQLLADPRVETSRADLEAQLDMLLQIRERLSQNNALINQLLRLKRQVEAWAARSDDERLRAAAGAICAEVEARLPLLINIGFSEAQLYASGTHEKFNALLDSVDSADYAPPLGARQVFAQLCDELDGHVAWARTDLGETVADFNAQVRELGLEAVDGL